MHERTPILRNPVVWIGSALDDMRAMPEEVKGVFGKQIDDVQAGVFPEGARPFREGLPSDIWKLVANDGGETLSVCLRRCVSRSGVQT
jgi:phage-related protein